MGSFLSILVVICIASIALVIFAAIYDSKKNKSNANSINENPPISPVSVKPTVELSTSVSLLRPNPTSEDGLSVAEILMLSYADKFHTGENEFQQFWKYHYEVDAQSLLEKLFKNEYITTASQNAALQHKTIPELKQILKENSLPVSGKKQDLISRIESNLPEENIRKYCKYQFYELTEKGQYIVNKYPNVLYAHRHPELDLSVKEILKTDMQAQDISLNKYQSRFNYYFNHNDWSNVRGASLTLSQLCNEQKDYLSALKYALVMAYIDLSGVNEKWIIEHHKSEIGKNGVCAILPYSLNLISKLIDSIDMERDTFIAYAEAIVSSMELPYYYYGKNATKEKLLGEILEYNGLK